MTRSLPPRPDLEQYRKQAKELLKSARAGDAASLQRVAEFLPGKGKLTLADAQFVIAREFGFDNWATFKQRIARDPLDDFKQAITRGDAQALRALLKKHPDLREKVNAPVFHFGGRPIAQAKQHREVVDLLLEHGADINLKSDWWAGPWGILENTDPETAEFLISRGAIVDIFAAVSLGRIDRVRELLIADPGLVSAKGGDGCRPLHYAQSKEMIDLLLDCGADIDARCVDHESTAAQWALPRPRGSAGGVVARGLDICRYLVQRGATPDVFMAVAIGDIDLLDRILHDDPQSVNAHVGDTTYKPCPAAPGSHIYVYTLGATKSPHQVAVEFGNQECFQRLLDSSSIVQKFLAACAMADADRTRDLLVAHPDLVRELSPNHLRLIADSAGHGQLDAVKLMLELGFSVEAKGLHGGTPLHQAAWFGHLPVLELLLQHSANVHAVDDDHHSTPLGWCMHGSRHCGNPGADYPAIARALLKAGAEVGPNLTDATPEVRDAVGVARSP